MSKEVDQRIVEMQFDNSNFNKNIDASIRTVDNLKKSLNFDKQAQAFDNISKAAAKTDISVLGKAADAVHKQFSALEIAMITGISNITNKIIGGIDNVVSQVSTLSMAEAGWDKYNTKVQAVQTIMKATGEDIDSVSYKLQDLADYTDKTSYSYAQMVDNIGKFTANGVNLEDAIKAIEGVANVAAISGVGAADPAAARAMYNFSQALAAGAVKAIDWKSIENANMATKKFKEQIIKTAKAIGTLNKEGRTAKGTLVTFQNFRETLSEGWFSSDVLIATLKEFADAESEIGKEAYKAAAEAKTFKDALGAVQDGISSSWLKSWEYLFGNYEEATKLWTSIQDYALEVLMPSNERRNANLEIALTSPYKRYMDFLKEVGFTQEQFEKSFREVLLANGVAGAKSIENVEEYLATLGSAGVNFDNILRRTLTHMIGTATATGDITEETEKYKKLVDEIINGKWGHGEVRFAALRDAGFDDDFVQELVNKTVWGQAIDWQEELKDKVKATTITYEELVAKAEAAGLAVEDIAKQEGRMLFWKGVRNIFDSLVEVFHAVRDAWQEVFPPATAEQIYNGLLRFYEFTKTLKPSANTLKQIKSLVRGLANIIKALGSVLRAVIDGIKQFVESLNLPKVNILDRLGSFGELLTKISKWITESERLALITDTVSISLSVVVGWVQKLWESIKQFFQEIKDDGVVQTFTSNVSNWFNQLGETLFGASSVFKDWFNFKYWPWEKVDDKVTGIKRWVDSMKELLGYATKTEDEIKNIGGSGGKSVKMVRSVLSASSLMLSKIMDQSIIDPPPIDDNGFITHTVSLWTRIKALYLTVKNFIVDKVIPVITPIFDFIRDNFVEAVKRIFALILIWRLASSMFKTSGFLEGVGDGLERLATGFSRLASGAKKMGAAAKYRAIGTMLKGVAALLLVVIGAVVVIASMPDDIQKNLWPAFIVVGSILALISVFIVTLTALTRNKDFKQAAGSATMFASLVPVAIAIGVVVVAIIAMANWLSGANADNLIRSLEIVGGVLLTMLVVAGVAAAKGAPNGTALSGILGLALALKVILTTITQLGDMEYEKMKQGLDGTAWMLTMLVALSVLIDGSKGADTGKFLIAAAGSLYLSVLAMKKLAEMDTEQYIQGLLRVAALFAVFGLVLRIAPKKQTLKGVGGAIFGMAASMLVVSLAIGFLGRIPTDQLVKGIIVVGILAGLMAGFVYVLGQFINNSGKVTKLINKKASKDKTKSTQKQADNFKGFVKAIATLVIAIAALAFVVAVIGQFDMYSLAKGMFVVGLLGVLILAIVKALGSLAGQKESQLKQTRKIIASIAIMVIALGGIIVAMSMMGNPGDYIVIALALGLLVVAIISSVNSLVKNEDISKQKAGHAIDILLVLSLFVVVCGALMAGMEYVLKITGRDVTDYIVIAGSLALVALALAGSVRLIGDSKITKAKTTAAKDLMLDLSIVLVAIGACLTIFTLITQGKDLSNMLIIATAMSELLLAFSVSMLILSKADGFKDMKGAVKAAGMLIIALAALVLIMAAFDLLKIGDDALLRATALSELMLAFSVSMLILSKADGFKDMKTPIGKAILLVVAVGALVALMKAFDVLDIKDGYLEKATAISVLMLAFAGAMLILSYMDKQPNLDFGTVMKVVGGLLVFLGGLALLLKFLEWLTTAFGFDKSALENNVIPFVNIIGQAVGALIGGVIEGIGLSIVKVLDALAAQITGFIRNLADAIKYFNDTVPDGAGEKVLIAAGALAALGVAEVISFIGWVTSLGGLLNWAQFTSLGVAVASFANNVKGINESDIEKAGYAADIVGKLTGSLGSNISIAGNVASLATHLGNLGTGVGSFAKSVNEAQSDIKAIDLTTVEKVVSIINTVMSADMPVQRSWINSIFGDDVKDVEKFAANLPALGDGIAKFVNGDSNAGTQGIKDINIDENTATKVGYVMECLAKLNNSDLKDAAGIVKIAGMEKTVLQAYSENLPALGQGMVDFISKVTEAELSNDGIEQAVKIGTMLADLNESIPDEQSTLSKFLHGGQDFTDYIANLKDFGKAIGAFVDEVSTIKAEDYQPAKDVTQALADMVQLSVDNPVESLNQYFSDAFLIAQGNMSTYLNTLKDQTNLDTITTTAEKWVTNFVDGFTGKQEDMNLAFQRVASNLLGAVTTTTSDDGMTSFNSRWTDAGKVYASNLKNGFVEQERDVRLGIKEAIQKILSDKDVGLTAVMGKRWKSLGNVFINNMKSAFITNEEGTAKANLIAAIHTLVEVLVTTAESHKSGFEDAGKQFLDGLKNGLYNYYKRSAVITAARSLGDEALAGLQASIDSHSPSQETEELGGFFVQGFEQGITGESGILSRLISGLGADSISALVSGFASGGLQNFNLMSFLGLDTLDFSSMFGIDVQGGAMSILQSLFGDVDLSSLLGGDGLVLTPVLDLSNIESGALDIQSLLSGAGITIGEDGSFNINDLVSGLGANGDGFDISALAAQQSANLTGGLDLNTMFGNLSQQMADFMNTPNQSITNTFNITGDNPEAIAEEVSKIITQQTQREASVWA